MACGGESGMDACRAGEHLPVGTPLRPKPACGRPLSSVAIILRLGEEPFSGATHQPTTALRSEEHTSELQSLMRISYAVFCLKKKKRQTCKKRQDTATHLTTNIK